ncbi:hypothetical protein BJP25_23290 [Actinokineospora bangkokensis]|uniref:Fe2OG dioxygenase domain-containing protein n=1 Tax=Actinokineospora bangkokensis TaxID=1193682 RepID=A0A1Q9LJN0_9PSEU|nr:hypothetical protein BJP25_23290 [Actinokineospora bangkokensis]
METEANVTAFPLAGSVPVVRATDVRADLTAAADPIREQLEGWGFMSVEVPGIGDRVRAMMSSFRDACLSTDPSLDDYAYERTPQLSNGGTHGFFPYNSEIPRLAKGVPDPKEFVHVSGGMLDNRPEGADALLRAFPEFAGHARAVFDTAFQVITTFSDVIRGMLPDGAPSLDLDRGATNLRVIHYRGTGDREVLAHEHSGIQMLGLQLPPSDGGLQYVLHDGTWVEPIIAGTDVLLCNVGRMLTHASENRFRPSTHRVHRSTLQTPQPFGDGEYVRMSSVMFAYPPHAAKQWQIGPDGLKTLDPTWGDFIANRFAGLGTALDS